MYTSQIEMFPAENLPAIPQIYSWGIEVIKLIQRIENPALTAFMNFISALGTQYFFLPLILFIFWLIDEKRGLRLGILIIASAWINIFVKDFLKLPRPFFLEPSLALAQAGGFGAPSGHAQLSLIFWISAAAWLTNVFAKSAKFEQYRQLVWAAACFFILLTGFSRIYLGVHFPTDIIAGWLLGGIILFICFGLGSKFSPIPDKLLALAGIRSLNICAAAITLLANGLYPRDRSLPALFLGFCIGYNLMKNFFPFSAQAEIGGKKPGVITMLSRCLIGFGGVAVIFLGLRLILPGEESLFGGTRFWGPASSFFELGRFLHYGLVGIWVSAGAPWAFQRMGLAQAQNTGDDSSEQT